MKTIKQMTIRNLLRLLVSLCLHATASSQETLPLIDGLSAEQDNSEVSVLLRIPAMLIEKSVNRDFEHNGPVNQLLLGTKSIGRSHCTGHVTCVVQNNSTGASMLCTIAGTVESKTRGTNGPAIIHSTSITRYVAAKSMTFNGHQFASSPTTVSSCTNLTINGIQSTLPRLAGRLVIRVASKRASDSKKQVEAIIQCQTEEELCQRIDADFEIQIADLNKQIASRLSILNYIPLANNAMYLRSRTDGVELAFGNPLATFPESQESRPHISESFEIWLLRSRNWGANRPLTANLINSIPTWLSTYFSDNPSFSKPDDRKWQMEVKEKWIVIKLHE